MQVPAAYQWNMPLHRHPVPEAFETAHPPESQLAMEKALTPATTKIGLIKWLADAWNWIKEGMDPW